MFNINNIVETFGKVYDLKKKRVVRAMKADQSRAWKQCGRRFEVFRPKHENPEPSEWLIPLYILLRPHVLFGAGTAQPSLSSIETDEGRKLRRRTFDISRLFRRREKPRSNNFRTDEGWVL